jgi:hypothetical protein
MHWWCPGGAWFVPRSPVDLTACKTTIQPPRTRPADALPQLRPRGFQRLADLVNAIGERIECLQFLRDLLQEIFDRVETAGDVVISAGHGFAELRCPAAAQDGGKVLGMPVKRDRERFERAGTTAALCLIAANFTNRCARNLGTLNQLVLIEAQLAHALVDRLRYRRPIVSHVLLRVLPGATVARS